MASFAERMGHRASRSLVQSDDLDVETRTELWNVLHEAKDALYNAWLKQDSETLRDVTKAIWVWEFKKPADEQPPTDSVWGFAKNRLLRGEWWSCLDLIENVVGYVARYEDPATRTMHGVLVEGFNNRFEHFLVGFRFISGEITPVGTTSEAEAVESALSDVDSIAGARHSLDRAVELLADRATPDYPNSIKESISAVEAVVKKLTGPTQDLGIGLKKLEDAGLTIHPALKSAWLKMYGWTSDDNGIRHAGIEAANADQALAKYMLVTCSAFVSYLIEEGRKTGSIA